MRDEERATSVSFQAEERVSCGTNYNNVGMCSSVDTYTVGSSELFSFSSVRFS